MGDFIFRHAAADLRQFVRYFWHMKSGQGSKTLTFPIGCPQLIFHRGTPLYIPELSSHQPRLAVSGQVNFASHVVADDTTDMIVAVLTPCALPLILGIDAHEFNNIEADGRLIGCNSLADLADIVMEATDLQAAAGCIEAWMRKRLAMGLFSRDFSRIRHCVDSALENSALTVTGLSNVSCLTVRQFDRVFKTYVGMSPKEYTRIVRFQKALWIMQSGNRNYADIAAVCSYSDQSHFIREFKRFSGTTPQKLLQIQTIYSDLYTSPV